MSKLPFARGKLAVALQRGKQLRRKRRKPSEFDRVYGGASRVRWQKARSLRLLRRIATNGNGAHHQRRHGKKSQRLLHRLCLSPLPPRA